MNRKSLIIFVLAAGVVAAALVFDGVSHHRAKNSDQTVAQDAAAAQAATTQPADASADASNSNQQDQSTDPAAADGATADAEGGQDAAQNGDAQADGAVAADATDASADVAEAEQPPAQPVIVPPVIVPAGTTLAIRLGEDLGSGFCKPNQRFSATLNRDIVVRGQTVIAAGTGVTGRVVAVRPAGSVTGLANLQLRITSIHLDNGSLAVATSTRSFGPTVKGKNKVGRFMKGLVKRVAGQEHEVLLAQQTDYSFTLERRLAIQ